ncbi:MAG: hypothetical protein SNJ50_17825 [Cyanobacteriota bacterium]
MRSGTAPRFTQEAYRKWEQCSTTGSRPIATVRQQMAKPLHPVDALTPEQHTA